MGARYPRYQKTRIGIPTTPRAGARYRTVASQRKGTSRVRAYTPVKSMTRPVRPSSSLRLVFGNFDRRSRTLHVTRTYYYYNTVHYDSVKGPCSYGSASYKQHIIITSSLLDGVRRPEFGAKVPGY